MALTDYTTYDEVRAALGVSDDEIEDATLALEMYSDSLILELEDIDLGVTGLFATVKALSEASRTDSQSRFFRYTRLFSTYAVGRQLASSLPLFGPKDQTADKTTVSRFADSPFRDVIKEVRAEYERYRKGLVTAYAAAMSSTATITDFNFFQVSSPSTDPVTG